jgi:hemoglobin
MMGTVETSTETPYQRIGGHDGIQRAVDALYVRVWADPELGPYFHRTDKDAQRVRLTNLLSSALGGPDTYTGKGLHEAHAGRGITHRHFSLLASHLADVLADLDVDEDTVDDVLSFIASARDEVVGDPS